jgi:hypothetical protein
MIVGRVGLVGWNHCVLLNARLTRSSESLSMLDALTGGEVVRAGGELNLRWWWCRSSALASSRAAACLGSGTSLTPWRVRVDEAEEEE